MSDIEHARSGIARVDCNAARVAGASTGSASDQGKAARVAASERGQRASFNGADGISDIEHAAIEGMELWARQSRDG